MSEGDRVDVKVGDERGSWGVVRLVRGGFYHVAIADGTDTRVYERSEIRKPKERNPRCR